MKKIKKSILTAVLGLVMCLSVVLGVAVGTRSNRNANAYTLDDAKAKEFTNIMNLYFQAYGEETTVPFDTSVLDLNEENQLSDRTGKGYTGTYKKYLDAYYDAAELVKELGFGTEEGLMTANEIYVAYNYNDSYSGAYTNYLKVTKTVFEKPIAVAVEINGLSRFAADDYKVTWADVEDYNRVLGLYNLLDTDNPEHYNGNAETGTLWNVVLVDEDYQKNYAGSLLCPDYVVDEVTYTAEEALNDVKGKVDAFVAKLDAIIGEINGDADNGKVDLGEMLERGVKIPDESRFDEIFAEYNYYAAEKIGDEVNPNYDAGAKKYIDDRTDKDDDGHDNIYLVRAELDRLLAEADEVIKKIGYKTSDNPRLPTEGAVDGYVPGELGTWIARDETLKVDIEDPITDEVLYTVYVGVKYSDTEKFYEYIGDLSGVDPDATSMYLKLTDDQKDYVKARSNWDNVTIVTAALKTINEKIDKAITEINNIVNSIALTTEVKYSLKPDYDVAFDAYNDLQYDESAQAYVRANSYYTEFQTIKSGLVELEKRAGKVDEALAKLEYYFNHQFGAEVVDGDIVKNSQTSMKAVKEALEKVYKYKNLGTTVNGFTFKIPTLEYKWADTEVTAFQDYGYLTNLEDYDDAVEIIANYMQDVADVEQQIADARDDVDDAESYKANDEAIEEAYDAYVELRYEEMYTGEVDKTLVNDWSVEVDNRETAVAMHNTLTAVKEYIVEVANMLGYEYTTADFVNADKVVDGAYAQLPNYPFVFDITDEVFVNRVDELIDLYEKVWTDEFEKNDTENAYELLLALQQAIKDEKDAKEELLADLASLEELLGAVRFSYIYNVNEIMGKAFKLQEATLRSFTIDEYKYLETLVDALYTLYSRAYYVDDAIANIYWYNDAEIVYDSMESVDAVTALLAKVYYNDAEAADYDAEQDAYIYVVEDWQKNPDTGYYELVDTRKVPYRFAEFDYTYDAENDKWTRWDKEAVELAAFQDETAHYLLVDDTTGLLLDIEDYEEAVETLEAYKAVAVAVRDEVATLVNELSPVKNYKVKEAVINDLYDRYIDLIHEEYEGENDWTQYVPEAGQILNVKTVLDALNAWIERVADAIVPGTAGQPASDNVIDAATADPTMVNLTLATINTLLHDEVNGYDQLVFDHIDEEEKVVNDPIKVASVEKAHDLLVARYNDLIEEGEQLQKEIDDLAKTLLEDGVRYSDRDVYEDLVARIAALDPDVAAEIDLDTTNVETLGEALDDLKSRLENAWLEFVQMILYRVEKTVEEEKIYYMDNDPTGTIVYASDDYEDTHSIAEAIEAVNAVYDGKFNEEGTYKIAYYPYDLVREVVVEYNTYKYGNTTEDGYEWTRWTEEDLLAMSKEGDLFVLSADELNALLIRYENAVKDFEDLRYKAKEVSDDIYSFEVENYKTQKDDIVALMEAYLALDLGEYNNLQPWVEPVMDKGLDIIFKLFDVYSWREAVAELVDENVTIETTPEAVDEVIEDALAEVDNETLELVVTLDKIEELLEEYDNVVNDPNDDEDAHYPYADYEDADCRINALEDAMRLLQYLKDYREAAIKNAIDALNELETDNITYRYHDDYVEAQRLYEEFKDDEAALDMIQKGLDDQDHSPEEILEIVGNALETIENSTKAAGSLIGTILYYEVETKTLVPGSDVVDEYKYVVVYASKDSIKAVHEAFNNIYNGDGHIANLPFGQVSEEEMAYLRNMVVEDEEVFANVDEFIKAFEALKALRLHARKVENGIKALMGEDVENVFGLVALDYDNNYKAQEEGINNLKAEFDLIKYAEVPSQWNDLTQWIGADYQEYLAYVVENLEEVNAWIYKVAYAVTEEATAATADAIIAAEVEKDYADDWSFRLDEILGAYEAYVALMEQEVAEEPAKEGALAEAKAVLDALYARMREVNNNLAEDIKELMSILSNKNLLNEKDYVELQEIYNRAEAVRTNYRKLSERQQAQLQTFNPYNEEYQTGLRVPNPDIIWKSIRPYTYKDFENAVGNFERALYFKQATDELFEKVGMDEENPHYTVEGYVLNKMLLSMYWTFTPEVREQVQSSYEKLMRITEGLDAEKAKEYDDDENTQSAIVDYEKVIKEVLGADEDATLEEALNKYQEDNQTAAQAAAQAKEAAEAAQTAAETAKTQAAAAQAAAETATAAQTAAEEAQAAAEIAQAAAETAKADAETARAAAESSSTTAAEKAAAAEAAQAAAETAQAAAEAAQVAAEEAQTAAAQAQADAEKAQADAETAQGKAETAQAQAEEAQAAAEAAQAAAVEAQGKAETAQTAAEAAQKDVNISKDVVTAAETAAKLAQNNAEAAQAAAVEAQGKAEAAQAAAVEAQGKAEAAQTDAETAQGKAEAAQKAADAAQTAAETAKADAETAKADAETAQGKAETAQAAAVAAQIAAEAAQTAAETAQGKAETAQTAAETAQGKAETAQTAAEAAQAAAETAQAAAETAQAAAVEAQGKAETAQAAAVEAQGKAEAAQTAAETAQAAAVEAQGKAETAQAAAVEAQGKAETAQAAAETAKADAEAAQAAADEAQAAADEKAAAAVEAQGKAEAAQAAAEAAQNNTELTQAQVAEAQAAAETAKADAEAAQEAAVEAQGKAETAQAAADAAKKTADEKAEAAETAKTAADAAQTAAETAKSDAETAKTAADAAQTAAETAQLAAVEAQSKAEAAKKTADEKAEAAETAKTAADAAQTAAETAKAQADAKAKAAAQAQSKAEAAQKAAEAAQAAAEKARDEKNDATNERVSKLKKALIITAVVGGVVAAGAVAGIVVLFGKTSAIAGGAASSSAASGSSKAGKEDDEE